MRHKNLLRLLAMSVLLICVMTGSAYADIGSKSLHAAKIQEIKDIYYNTQAILGNCSRESYSDGTTAYFYGSALKKISAPPGTYKEYCSEKLNVYSAEFYYDSTCTLRFALIYNGAEKHRYYIDVGSGVNCIRYIDDEGHVFDYYQNNYLRGIPGPSWFCEMGYMEPHFKGLI